MLWIMQCKVLGRISNDMFGEFDSHVVGIVSVLNNSSNDKSGSDFSQHIDYNGEIDMGKVFKNCNKQLKFQIIKAFCC